ncbi:HAD family hydrolase [Pseudoalteromonas xiamenensis]|uniref:HAD family hydrolase n=1 Tax=Pseudoalteromonas xiamenensis TaxID=882626 RepID=UPI0035EFAFDC
MDIQAILFDFDGTLVDSEVLHYLSWVKVLAPFSIVYSESDFCDEFSGVPTLETAEILRLRHQLPLNAQTLTEQKNQHFVETSKTIPPTLMPNAKAILQESARDFRLALVTGSSRAEAIPVLQHYGLLELFEVVICKEDVENPKPSAEPYLKALKAMQLSAYEAVAMEDSATGLVSAKSAALYCVVIPHQHSEKQDFAQADHRASDLSHAFFHVQSLASHKN